MSKVLHIRKHASRLIAFVAICGFAGGLIYLVKDFMASKPEQSKKVVQQVTLFRPPPPPPPPKIEEPPPEPEIEEELDIPEPEAMEELPDLASDEPLPGNDLGLDAEGGAGGDGFGLVGRKGGRGLLAEGAAFSWIAGQLRKGIEDALSLDDKVRSEHYSLIVRVWLSPDGSVTRVELGGSTGSEDVDESIRTAIENMPALAEAPPLEMPQPVKLRVSSRL